MRELIESLQTRAREIKQKVGKKTNQTLDKVYENVLTSPASVVVLLIIVATFFAQQGMSFQSQIDDDVEIFLPDGAPSTELLLEVREEWSTDITVIYIKSNNADPAIDDNGNPEWIKGDANITDKAVLDVISWVEGMLTMLGVTPKAVESIMTRMTMVEMMEYCG